MRSHSMKSYPFVLWLVASVCLNSHAKGDEVVYKRQLPNHQALVVTRHEATDVPPDKPLPPGYTYPKTDHVYDYDFSVSSSSVRSQPTKMWTHQFYSYSPSGNLPTDFQILDVAVEGRALIVVYKESNKTWGGVTFANVIVNAPQGNRHELSRKEAQLIYDSDGGHIFISKAKISGSIRGQTLTVQLTNVDTLLRFSWKNHRWQEVLQATPDSVKQDQHGTRVP